MSSEGNKHKQRRIYPAANKAQASGPVTCAGVFQGPVPNFVFIILYSFSSRRAPKLLGCVSHETKHCRTLPEHRHVHTSAPAASALAKLGNIKALWLTPSHPVLLSEPVALDLASIFVLPLNRCHPPSWCSHLPLHTLFSNPAVCKRQPTG